MSPILMRLPLGHHPGDRNPLPADQAGAEGAGGEDPEGKIDPICLEGRISGLGSWEGGGANLKRGN